METEIQDFVRFCAVERRLAPLTCSAYERDVRACKRFLAAEGRSGWDTLRQSTGDARLVAEYLGHADLSTVSRYAHVAVSELHEAAAVLGTQALRQDFDST